MSAAPSTAVHICNLALDRIGQAPIVSIDAPTSEAEEICARHYDQTRRELLRSYVFNFSRKLAVWTADDTVTPAFGYSTAYRLPNDFIRLMAVGDVSINNATPARFYDFNDGYLYCDYGNDPDGGIDVQYIFDARNVAKYDALFIKLFKLEFAKNISFAFTLKQSLITGLDKELEDVRLAAAAVAGQEKPVRREQHSRVRDVRRSQGIYRDNTRV